MPSETTAVAEHPASKTLLRVFRYTFKRLLTLVATVAVGVFLGIVLINYGGFIDHIFRAEIGDALIAISLNTVHMPQEERAELLKQVEQQMVEAYGLNQPFLSRCFRFFLHGVTLDWGPAERIKTIDDRYADASVIILERVPNTLLLVGTANLLLFFASLSLALYLSRKHGGFWDRITVAFSPLSSVPNWIYGIILCVVFAAELHLLPYNGMYDRYPPAVPAGYILVVLKHMVLPVAAISLTLFPQLVYVWRTAFLIHSSEDYVELAEAKGLPSRMVERRYILRPTLPYIITDFALMVIAFWQGVIVLETFFNWPGVGQLFIQAVTLTDRPVLIGLIVIFAYLLALTIFLLDFIYALLDPRVKVEAGRQVDRVAVKRPGGLRALLRRPAGASVHTRIPGREWRPDAPARVPVPWRERWRNLGRGVRHQLGALREIARYPGAVVGLVLIVALVGVSIYTVIAIPYDRAIQLWNASWEDCYRNPRNALPAWVNFFRQDKLPETIVVDSQDGAVSKQSSAIAEGITQTVIVLPFSYPYSLFPQDLNVNLEVHYKEKRPAVSLTWRTPDGREIELGQLTPSASRETYYLLTDERLQRRLKGQQPLKALFADPAVAPPVALQGTYELRVTALTFEKDSSVDSELVVYGQVYGMAGTDHRRRDLLVALLWGAPVALIFGLLGAVVTTFTAVTLAAVGVWFGGWVDKAIQWITEVNMILPTLPIAITVYYLYSHSLWVVLGVIVLLNIFGATIKNYRAIFLQVVESPYIEAARAYGTSNWRMILRYLVPRIRPIMVPQLVILVPGYAFLEATLAYLGVSDVSLPTWGKVIVDALSHGAFEGFYYWILEPIALLMLTGLACAMVGYALDRIFNPRLRRLA